MEVKMFMINEEGKKVIKEIPENLTSFYKNAGWDFYKEEKVEIKPTRKFTNKEKDND